MGNSGFLGKPISLSNHILAIQSTVYSTSVGSLSSRLELDLISSMDWLAPKIFVETCKPTLFTFNFCYHVVQNLKGSLGAHIHMGTQILVVLAYLYSQGKACLSLQIPWRAATDPRLARSRSRVQAPAPSSRGRDARAFSSTLPTFLLFSHFPHHHHESVWVIKIRDKNHPVCFRILTLAPGTISNDLTLFQLCKYMLTY